MKQRLIKDNDIFERWQVIKAYSKRVKNHNYSLCKCRCGNIKDVLNYNLVHGISKSCGCLDHELASERMKLQSRTHGQTGTRLYEIWKNMIRRVRGKQTRKNYYDRGITICKDWLDFVNFYEWAQKSGYKENLTIDRIDNNKGYYPENCRWATMQIQANNKTTNRFVTYKGRTETLANWSRILNINYSCLKYRVNHNNDLVTGKKNK